MSHALVTIICAIPETHIVEARRLTEALGNPASPAVQRAFEAISATPGGLAIHFSSITVFPATAGGAHLIFEFSGDGSESDLIAALTTQLGPLVEPVFALGTDRGGESLADYWTSHVVTVGQGFFDNAGVLFAGTPGLSVTRIRGESALRERLKELVEEDQSQFTSALATLDRVRARLRDEPSFHGLMDERDPLVGNRHHGAGQPDDGFSLPMRESPVRLKATPDFVRVLGGGYFFLPGRTVLRYLADRQLVP